MRVSRIAVMTVMVVAGVLAAIATGAGAAGAKPTSGDPKKRPDGDNVQVLREGTEITNESGYFESTGDRATFTSADSSHSFGVLENLALERVVQSLSELSGRRQWSVSGVVTEFRGTNYLLVRRAVLKPLADN